MKKDFKEVVFEFLAECADPESVKDICIPNCKVIFEGGPVLHGRVALKRHMDKEYRVMSTMGMNGLKMSNYKEGGSPQEPWCRYQFTIHNDEGFVYRKGTVSLAFVSVQGNLLMQSAEWTYADLQRINWNT